MGEVIHLGFQVYVAGKQSSGKLDHLSEITQIIDTAEWSKPLSS